MARDWQKRDVEISSLSPILSRGSGFIWTDGQPSGCPLMPVSLYASWPPTQSSKGEHCVAGIDPTKVARFLSGRLELLRSEGYIFETIVHPLHSFATTSFVRERKEELASIWFSPHYATKGHLGFAEFSLPHSLTSMTGATYIIPYRILHEIAKVWDCLTIWVKLF